jgi:hypothetical protein
MEICGVTMSQGLEGATKEFAEHPVDYTIELVQTGEHVFGLSPGFRTIVTRRQVRNDFICGLTLAVVAMGVTAGIVSGAAGRHPRAPAVTTQAWVASPEVAPAEPPEGTAVQVRNPFDATEVFEFPPETTKAEARAATAELLLKRARERLDQGLGITHSANRPATRVAAARSKQTARNRRPAEVFVTRLAADTNPTNRL